MSLAIVLGNKPVGAARSRLLPWLLVALLALILMLAGCASPVGIGDKPLQPIGEGMIDLDGNCAQTDEAGFRERARLKVSGNRVQALSWELWVGQRGSCRFEQAEFRQTRSGPHLELLARDGSGCRLMVWQEARRITLAHHGCENRCTPGIYDQAWPVMFDPRSGSCARL
jgi:hypothetical protein